MDSLINTLKSIPKDRTPPFLLINAKQEQNLSNTPIAYPTLIVVLKGEKHVGLNPETVCHAGDFIFLADGPEVHLRNIPVQSEYLALAIEFDLDDFPVAPVNSLQSHKQLKGKLDPSIELCLKQYVEWAAATPKELHAPRRKEIIQLLCSKGYDQILQMAYKRKISNQIHALILKQLPQDITAKEVCDHLAMSESTMQRRLKEEDQSLQTIKDRAKLGQALFLLQGTQQPIGFIAQECGYGSQSRFTDRFKTRYGLTPSALRKTKMTG